MSNCNHKRFKCEYQSITKTHIAMLQSFDGAYALPAHLHSMPVLSDTPLLLSLPKLFLHLLLLLLLLSFAVLFYRIEQNISMTIDISGKLNRTEFSDTCTLCIFSNIHNNMSEN